MFVLYTLYVIAVVRECNITNSLNKKNNTFCIFVYSGIYYYYSVFYWFIIFKSVIFHMANRLLLLFLCRLKRDISNQNTYIIII